MKIVDIDDRRLHPRIEANVDLVIATGLRRISGTVIDVSVGGAMIAWNDVLEKVEDVLAVGQFVDLDVAEHIMVQGFVVRIGDGTFAVAFDIADDELPLVQKQMSEVVGHEFRAA